MSSKRGMTLSRVMRRLAAGQGDEQTSDRDLLRRFAQERDEAAFAVLVRRHSTMVLGVALRVLRHHQDAEDVCQATFLLLARKAATTAWRESVANWLYGVAYRLALKSREAAQRRTARQGKAQPRTPPDALAEITVRDLQNVLDEELQRVPQKYRAPFILCCLEGKTRDEAARFLGLPLTTVGSRLEAGREALRRRLAQRGIAFSLALVGAAMSAKSAAAVPAEFAATTVQAALHIAAGGNASTVVSGNVAFLVQRGIHAMFLAKLKIGLLCGLVLAATCIAAWYTVPNTSAQDAPKQPPVRGTRDEKKSLAREPEKSGRGTLLLAREGGLVTLTPEGKEGSALAPPKDTSSGFNGRLSPDGTHVAYTVTANGPPQVEPPPAWPFKIVVRKVGADEPTAVIDMPAQRLSVLWAPDSKRLLVNKETGPHGDTVKETLLLDPNTGKTEPFELPSDVRVLDCARDGKTFLVIHRHEKKFRLAVAAKGDKEARVLTELKTWIGDQEVGRLSPDGKKVLYTDADPADKDANKWGASSKPYLFDIAAKKRTALADFPLNARATGIAWSPDGKRVAYAWMQLHPELLKKDTINAQDTSIPTEAFLIIADADGRNARTVSSASGPNAINWIFGAIDWR